MGRDGSGSGWQEAGVERVDTGFRILESIFFAIVFRLVESLIAAVVIFQLGYSLVTERPPSDRIMEFGNRLSSYAYQLFRYMTHNSCERPFPFSDFPQALEASSWPYAEGARGHDEYLDEEGVERRRALLAPLSSASSSTQKRSDTASSDTTSRI